VSIAKALQPVFYYDLGSPVCYLAAERIMVGLPAVPEWEPVLGASIGIEPLRVDRATIEREAGEQGLLPLRWPAVWPPDARFAALAATYAKQIGRAVAFSMACFRQAFAAGRDLGDADTVLIAAAACEMHPSAVLRGAELRSIAIALEGANTRALRAAPRTLPAVQVGDRVFDGPAAIEAAARALA
jgi:2-hydroxychromene-2-carboxylate isomerase